MADKRISPEEARRIIEEEQARKILAEREARELEEYNKSPRGRIYNKAKETVQNTRAYQYVQDRKDAFVGRATEITINTAKSKKFWSIFVLGLILFLAAYYKFPSFRTFVLGFGVSVAGLIAIFIIILFIISGIWKGFKGNLAALFIAIALSIWLLDLAPAWLIPGWPSYAGFELPPLGLLPLTLLPVLTSSFTFSLFYINMVLKIIKKEYLAFILAFVIILISDYFLPKIVPSYLNIGFSIPFGQYFLIAAFLIGGWFIWKYDRGRRGTEVAGLFSSLYMMFVFSFFWLNNGWQGNVRAWIHAVYIIFFGFVYIKQKEKDNPIVSNFLIPTLLIVDFFGYGLLWNSDYLVLRYIPPIVVFVIAYCYVKESNEVDGQKKATYPVMAFILLVTFFLIMSVKVAGLETNTLPFIAKQGTTFTDFYSQFTDNLRQMIENRLDIATAGLYRGNVEKNRYESLGVYFGNIRASDPRFYTDEPITVWGTIRSKTYKDAVIVNFNCSRWKDSKRIYADKVIPEIRFPIFTLEEVDTQCTFLPKTENPVPAGANIVTLSAEYNFGTDSYLKAYFMDRERFRASAREGVDPLTQFGIKDKTPGAVFTNGPVEIGLSAGQQPITVSEGYAIKPIIGITLTNRKEIQDKDKRIITRWEGKIKNITELILLTPYGITLGTQEKLDKCKDPKTDLEKLECPCSMPFSLYDEQKCYNSCVEQVLKPCNTACASVNKDSKDQNAEIRCNNECGIVNDRCLDECRFLFQVNEGEGPTKEKYNAYALDVGSKQFKDLNKDIDKSRSFVCRFEPSSAVLGDSPITTRYFRVRARYNYLLENSVTVNVETVPVGAANTVPDAVVKTVSEIRSGGPLWFEGYSNELISAIASVESNFKHCCQEQQSYEIGKKIPGAKCTPTGQTECDFNYLLTSGLSYGVMQINYVGTNKEWADRLANQHCKKDSSGKDIKINNYNCNLLVGIAILKSKYETFKGGCGSNPKISKACNICRSNIAPYTQYSSYRGVEAALRGYNGWGCPASGAIYGDAGYVERILKAKTTIKGIDIIDPSTLGSINREGAGMADATPTQSEDMQMGVQSIPELSPINVDAFYDYRSQVVTIRWNKPSSLDVISYDVTRFSAGEQEAIVQGCQDMDGTSNYCVDADGQKLTVGKPYTYTVYAYDNKGRYSGTKTYMTK